MIERGRGRIVVVGSSLVGAPSYAGRPTGRRKPHFARTPKPSPSSSPPSGIRVNMLTPGQFPTLVVRDLLAEKRVAASREVLLGQRERGLAEVGPVTLSLLSGHLVSYTTGTELFVDGGLHLRPLYVGSRGDSPVADR